MVGTVGALLGEAGDQHRRRAGLPQDAGGGEALMARDRVDRLPDRTGAGQRIGTCGESTRPSPDGSSARLSMRVTAVRRTDPLPAQHGTLVTEPVHGRP